MFRQKWPSYSPYSLNTPALYGVQISASFSNSPQRVVFLFFIIYLFIFICSEFCHTLE